MGGALGSGGGSVALGITGPTMFRAISILSGSFLMAVISAGGAAPISNSERVPASTPTVLTLARRSSRNVGSIFAVSIFLGFKVGRNSRVALEDGCTTRYVDRAIEPGAAAEDVATGALLGMGAVA